MVVQRSVKVIYLLGRDWSHLNFNLIPFFGPFKIPFNHVVVGRGQSGQSFGTFIKVGGPGAGCIKLLITF